MDVVGLFWKLTHMSRRRLKTVLDLGAGDCRFANGGKFDKYVGIEIDAGRAASAQLPKNGRIEPVCRV